MKKTPLLLSLPLILSLSACSLFPAEPSPTPLPTPTPTPTMTAPPVDPDATELLAGSSIEAAWQAAATTTFEAYTESGFFGSRITYPDGSEAFTYFFVEPHTLMLLSKPDLTCDFRTYKLTPIFEGVGLPHESSTNQLLYVGQVDDGSETPTAYLADNNLFITTYNDWESNPRFTVGVTKKNKLVQTFEGTYANMKPLEAVTRLASFDYAASFSLINKQDPNFKFSAMYQHTYAITDLLPETTVEAAAEILERSYEYYDPAKELLYDFDKDEFYLYDFEKNKLTRLKNGKPSSFCKLPDEE